MSSMLQEYLERVHLVLSPSLKSLRNVSIQFSFVNLNEYLGVGLIKEISDRASGQDKS